MTVPTGRIGPYEKEYLRKDGSRAWMVFAGASLGDGTVVEYCIDVSHRKRAEAALREQARLIREVAAAGLTIHSAGSLDSVLRVIAEEARRVLGAHRGLASLTVGDSDTLRFVSHCRASDQLRHLTILLIVAERDLRSAADGLEHQYHGGRGVRGAVDRRAGRSRCVRPDRGP